MARFFSLYETGKTGRWSVRGYIPTLERGNDTKTEKDKQ
jgi:hypothetical protein